MWPTFVPADDITQQISYNLPAVQTAFNAIVHGTEIDFDFCQGGCQQRAHVMSLLLQKKYNIQHCKIWLFAPATIYNGNTETFFVEDKNHLAPGSIVNWNYHVAPAVLVNDNGQENFYIIDPSIDKSGPMIIGKWFAGIGNSKAGRYSFYHADKYFFNSLYTKDNGVTNVFDGTFTGYVQPDTDDLTIEKGLAINDAAMHVYHTYIAPLNTPGNTSRELEDLKAIFANSTALDLLLSQNISGSTPNTTHRYVITNYGNILLDAKKVFYERLVYWANYMNELIG